MKLSQWSWKSPQFQRVVVEFKITFTINKNTIKRQMKFLKHSWNTNYWKNFNHFIIKTHSSHYLIHPHRNSKSTTAILAVDHPVSKRYIDVKFHSETKEIRKNRIFFKRSHVINLRHANHCRSVISNIHNQSTWMFSLGIFQNPINKFNRLEPAVDPYPIFGGTALFAHGP